MLQKNDVYFLIILGSIVFLMVALFLLLFVQYFLKRKGQIILEKEIMEKQFIQTLLQSQVEIQEQTLQYIGRELHDNLGQVASLIKINLNTLEFISPAEVSEKIEDTKDLTRQLITDIKSLSVSLDSSYIRQFGLAKALETEVARLNKTGRFTAGFQHSRHVPSLDLEKSTILFRMAQEALNNIVKHSRAEMVRVVLSGGENKMVLEICDDGAGFDIENSKKSSGAGLHNLEKRAALINASLSIESSQGKGTCITIQFSP